MSSHQTVYHIKDKDLFDVFIRELPHKVLLEPVRKDGELRNRYFKGYRISDNSPEKEALGYAYYRELNNLENIKLLNFLCQNWVDSHSDLAKQGLNVIGVEFPKANWLADTHDFFAAHGNIETAKAIARSLAITYPANEILIVISILSDEYNDQPTLRQAVHDEIVLTQNDPNVIREHLQNELTSVTSRQLALKKVIDETKSQAENREAIADKQSKELKQVLNEVESEFQVAGSDLAATRKEFEVLQERLKEQNLKATALKQRKDKLENQIDSIRNKLTDDTESDRVKLDNLQADYNNGVQEENRLREQIKSVEARIREDILASKVKENDSTGDAVQADQPHRQNIAVGAVEWTDRLNEVWRI